MSVVPGIPPQPVDLTGVALAAGKGDPGATTAFVRATRAEVWRFVASLTSPADADDLTQDTYLRAVRALPTFAARASARTWLLSIARRVCADHLRSVVRQRRVQQRLAAAPPDGPVVDRSGLHAVADLVGGLAEDRRVAFVLTQVLGLSYAEAAEVASVPVGTVRSRVARARADLVDAVRAADAG
ncbi:MAG TPA: sigma-70 family RNA polymerase sigma factor [Actinoplanes sp.]|nr:sigma-70 family RNA polymerase sigma factor [Actinoplanes sp.]